MCAVTEQLDELKRRVVQYQQAIEMKQREVEALASQQEANWQKQLSRVTPILQQLKIRNDELGPLHGAIQNLIARIEGLS